jgi:hypothetical protein
MGVALERGTRTPEFLTDAGFGAGEASANGTALKVSAFPVPASASSVRALRRIPAPANPPLPPKQLDLFPVKPVIEPLDPRSVIGARTAVAHLIRVRLHPTDVPHLVFNDRHGWYCEAHGPQCEAVHVARIGMAR